MTTEASVEAKAAAQPALIRIRPGLTTDVNAIIRLDEKITGLAKPDYWRDLFARYGDQPGRYFLVAEPATPDADGAVVGFIIGEVRAWEFGSPPCGWIFALGVDPEARLQKTGTLLFEAICSHLAEDGVDTVRTMLARDDELNMTFFRAQGMRGGPFIQLEMALD